MYSKQLIQDISEIFSNISRRVEKVIKQKSTNGRNTPIDFLYIFLQLKAARNYVEGDYDKNLNALWDTASLLHQYLNLDEAFIRYFLSPFYLNFFEVAYYDEFKEKDFSVREYLKEISPKNVKLFSKVEMVDSYDFIVKKIVADSV